MREIVLDTETTGLDPEAGHRVVEIGCIELINHLPTDNHFHVYLNPDRDMPDEAFRVHGLSEDFLSTQPRFQERVEDFLEFIADDPLVIHNASFDMKFLNAELGRLKRPPIPLDRAIDTVRLARRKFPGQQANLDALCRRFGIDNSNRDLHGALIDARLLADVYLELIGGREPGFSLEAKAQAKGVSQATAIQDIPNTPASKAPRPPRPHAPSAEEIAAHAALLEKITDPIWNRYDGETK